MDKDYFRHEIGERIVQIRKSRGLTQQQLAEKSGIKQENISRIERGCCNVTIDTLNKLSVVLDFDFSLTIK